MKEVQRLREQAEYWRGLAQRFTTSNLMLSATFVSMAFKLETKAHAIERQARERPEQNDGLR